MRTSSSSSYNRYKAVRLLLIFAALPVALYAQGQASQPLRGFPASDWAAQHTLEKQAHAVPSPDRLRLYMERMAGAPHHAGSPGSKQVAEYAAALLRDWGLDTRIEQFEAFLPYPTARLLEMTEPERFTASLREPAVDTDASTGLDGSIEPFNAYSAAGDVTAPVIYVNYGLPEDYEYLERVGVDVRGKIVIARYGKSWRGLKPKLAQEHGAVACILYSDPHDDGFFVDETYPDGPMRPMNGVQRGSIIDMALYPGDPLTPGWASEPGSQKLAPQEAPTILRIPVLPVSWADAKPLLEHLSGPVAPEPWRGALPITYHIGAGPAVAHLRVEFEWAERPLYNVIATIPGSEFPNEWIVYGNHHDAWVTGASDPASGASVLLESARSLSVLLQAGWRPKRTIVLALWDGEEFGLIGSTEWVEKHLDELERGAAVYLNTDSTGNGALNAGGSHSLERFVTELLRDIDDPEARVSLLDAIRQPRTEEATISPALRPEREFRLSALGAGSDYVAFLHHAGVASVNLGFSAGNGQYHSAYDTVQWYETYSDSTREYGAALSRLMTTALLRLSGARVLPFEFEGLARTIRRYLDEVRIIVPASSGAAEGLQEVTQASARLLAAGRAYEAALDAAMRRAKGIDPDKLAEANDVVRRVERALSSEEGLPGRTWYRHQLYAPGLFTGYAPKTLPGVREAAEARRWNEANEQAHRLAEALRRAAVEVDQAALILRQAAR